MIKTNILCDGLSRIARSFFFCLFLVSGPEEETRLLQNPPRQGRQSLLTAFVPVPQVLERRHLGSSQSKGYSCKGRPHNGVEYICSSNRYSWGLPGFKGQCAHSTWTTFKENSPFTFARKRESRRPPGWLSLQISREACSDSGRVYHASGSIQRLK